MFFSGEDCFSASQSSLGLRPSMLSIIHISVFIVAILVLVLFREPILIVLDQGHSVTLETIKFFPKTFKPSNVWRPWNELSLESEWRWTFVPPS